MIKNSTNNPKYPSDYHAYRDSYFAINVGN